MKVQSDVPNRKIAQTRGLRARHARPQRTDCRFTTYRYRFARAAPAPRAKRKIRRIVDAHRPSNDVAFFTVSNS